MVVTHRPDSGYGPIPCQLSQEETASLRAELSVPTGWILETLFYDLGHTVSPTGLKLEGYRAAIHGVRVLRRTIMPHPSGKPAQIYTLNGGELTVPPGGTVPLYACLTMVTPDGKNAAVVGAPGPDSHLWKDGSRPFLQYILVTLSIRIHYQESQVFAERRWHPDLIRTIEQVGGLEVSKDAKEVNRARQDFRLIDDLSTPRPKGGRPADWPDEPTFRAKVEPVVRALRTRYGKATRDKAAEELHISSDWLKDLTHDLTGIEWPAFVNSVDQKDGN